MPSQTRLRMLREWPMCIIVDEWDADGYAVSAHSKLLQAPDGVTSFLAPAGDTGPGNWRDRHGRYSFKALAGHLAHEARPLDALCRQAEIDLRMSTLYSDADYRRAMESGDFAAIQASQGRVVQDVDTEISAKTPLRPKAQVVEELRNRRRQ